MYLIAVYRRTLRSANAGAVHVRAVRIPPAIMLSVTAQDLNIVRYTDVPYTDAGDGDRIWCLGGNKENVRAGTATVRL